MEEDNDKKNFLDRIDLKKAKKVLPVLVILTIMAFFAFGYKLGISECSKFYMSNCGDVIKLCLLG